MRAMRQSPPLRFHLTRYAGVLASNAALRAEVVPGRARAERREHGPCEAMQRELFGDVVAHDLFEKTDKMRPTRHPWAWLLRRVFAVEVLVCVHCAGKLRLVEIATEATAITRIIRDERPRTCASCACSKSPAAMASPVPNRCSRSWRPSACDPVEDEVHCPAGTCPSVIQNATRWPSRARLSAAANALPVYVGSSVRPSDSPAFIASRTRADAAP